MRLRFVHAVVFAALALATTAKVTKAQPAWVEDRAYAEGKGIKAGEWEIHPGLGGQFGYDSNFFQRSGTKGLPNEHVRDALRLRLTPSVSATTYGRRDRGQGPPPKLGFTGSSSLSYNELFPVNSGLPGTGNNEVQKQRHLAGGVGGQLDVLPKRPWGGDLFANYRRTFQPSNIADTNIAWNRHTVNGGGGIKWQPGGGLFMWRIGYRLRATFFQSPEFKHLNNVNQGPEMMGRWAFLPRTVLLYHGQVGFINYNYTRGTGAQNNGRYARSILGVNGLVTNHFGLLGAIGWGSTFYDARTTAAGVRVPGENFDSVIGQAQATWYLASQSAPPGGTGITNPRSTRALGQGFGSGSAPYGFAGGGGGQSVPIGLSSISAGYIRQSGNSYFGSYFQNDRGYAKVVYVLASKVLLSLRGGLSHITRPRTYFADAPTRQVILVGGSPKANGYSENRADAQVFAEYRLSGAIGINATFRYNANLTKVCVPLAPGEDVQQVCSPRGLLAGPAVDRLDYTRFRAYLGLRWFL